MKVTELSSSRGTGQDLSCHPQGLRSRLLPLSSNHLPRRRIKIFVRQGVRPWHRLLITEGSCHHELSGAPETFLLF